MSAAGVVSFTIPEIKELSQEALIRAGLSAEDAATITEVYLEAELWGRKSHGFRLIPWTLEQMKDRKIGEITIEQETPVSALLDGGNRHGCVVAHRAMTRAIDKARQLGMGVIGIHNAGNIGMAGYYVKLASDHGLNGIVMAHTPALVVPYGGADSILGTNPLAIGIPAQPYPIILDMATSAVGFHHVMMAQATGQPLPPGSALDKYGRPTRNPDQAVEDGIHFLPFGGYKGSGLSLMIEILAGCWTNSLVGAEKTGEIRSDFFGSLFIAMQPELLLPRHQFDAKIQLLMERIKTSKPAAGFTAIRLPGERGQQNRESLLKAGRLELDAATAAYLQRGREI
jgi:L-2-hydroxycarboxylate dehydrogenase (NAD+)